MLRVSISIIKIKKYIALPMAAILALTLKSCPAV